MKIIRNILFLLIVSFIIIGCEKKENLVLECTTTIKDTKERVQIKFYDSNTATRIVTVKKDKDYKQKIESIKQNYCNNRIKKEYSCEVEIREENIVLTEKSNTHIIMGESKELDIKTYKNNLIKKGFKCQNTEK